MSGDGSATCKHCGERIVRSYTVFRDWTHQKSGAAFQDGQHHHCHRTFAEPDTDTAEDR